MLNAAEKYHASNNLQVQASRKLLLKAKDHLVRKNFKDAKLIDIGTGDGRVLSEVFVNESGIEFSKVVGTDRRKDVIDFAQKIYGNEKMSFEVLDIEHSSEEEFEEVLRNGPFDLVTSSWCLQFALDHEKTFKNINKLLRPGGSFYFNFLAYYELAEVHFKLAEIYPKLKRGIYDDLPLLSKNKNYERDLPEILRRSGFEIEFLKFEKLNHDFGDEALWRETFSSSLPYLYGINKNLLEKVMKDYVRIWREMYGSTEKEPFNFTFTLAHGLITKK